MSGHSKWATTKHKKAVIDAKRGKMFAKLIKNIEVAARMGGGDPAGNPTLYDAIQKAKKSSVPNDNIDRAVKRGSGAEAGGADYQTIMYEGYGPAGVAMLIECLTDNRNRAAMEVRTAMTRNGGSLADPGSVSYLFNRKGVVIVPTTRTARRSPRTTSSRRPSTPAPRRSTTSARPSRWSPRPTDLVAVRTALQAAGIDYDSAEASFVPDMQVELDEDGAAQDVPADRRARGPRRRAERLRQLRRLRRGHGGARLTEWPARRGASTRVSALGTVGRSRLASGYRTGVRTTKGDQMRVLGVDPGLTRCGVGRGRGRRSGGR